MKVFLHDNRIFKEKELENLNKWIVSKGRQPVENPIFQDVPDDVDIKDFENGVFSQSLYTARKQAEIKERYNLLVIKYIHEKYPIDKEIEIMFEKDKNPAAVAEHDTYVKECKERAKKERAKAELL